MSNKCSVRGFFSYEVWHFTGNRALFIQSSSFHCEPVSLCLFVVSIAYAANHMTEGAESEPDRSNMIWN